MTWNAPPRPNSARAVFRRKTDPSLTVTTADGTATAPADYYSVSAAPYSIADGQMGRFIPVSTKADTVFEPDETFTVTLADLDASGTVNVFDLLAYFSRYRAGCG